MITEIKKISYVLLAHIIFSLGSLLMYKVGSLKLNRVEFADYIFIINVVSLLTIVLQAIPPVISREVAINSQIDSKFRHNYFQSLEKYLQYQLFVILSLDVITLLLGIIFFIIFKEIIFLISLVISSIGLFMYGYSWIYNSYFIGLEEFKKYFVIQALIGFLKFFFTLIFLSIYSNVSIGILAFSIAPIVSVIYGRNKTKLFTIIPKKIPRHEYRIYFSTFTISFVLYLFTVVDVILLKLYFDNSNFVVTYIITANIGKLFYLINSLINVLSFSTFSKAKHKQQSMLRKKYLVLFISIIVPLYYHFIKYSRIWINIFYNRNLVLDKHIFQLTLLAYMFFSIASLVTFQDIPLNRVKKTSKIISILLVAFIITNLILLKKSFWVLIISYVLISLFAILLLLKIELKDLFYLLFDVVLILLYLMGINYFTVLIFPTENIFLSFLITTTFIGVIPIAIYYFEIIR